MNNTIFETIRLFRGRMEISLPEGFADMPDYLARSNADYKSIKNKDGKEILMTPETLVLTNNKDMTIIIDDYHSERCRRGFPGQ